MKKKLIWMLLMALSLTLFTSGCGMTSEEKETVEDAGILKSLESGTYYVMHKDKTVEPLYFGCATFDIGSTVSTIDNSRVVWFKDDFSEIPTLYAGDSLIFYSTEELGETFYWERYEDIGYSIGICHLTTTKSGRYQISTNPNNNNTYPGSDADEILFFENSNVIIDTVGGVELRAKDNEIEPRSVSKCGSLLGLNEGDSYDLEIYAGTEQTSLRLKADVRFMYPMELATTMDYSFENNTIINIKIPDAFENGYYMVNGIGMFRYYKDGTDTIPDDAAFFNFPSNTDQNGQIICSENININNDESYSEEQTVTIGGESNESSYENNIDWTPNGFQREVDSGLELSDEDYLHITETGQKTLNITLTTDREGDGLPDPVAYVTTPTGEQYEMIYTNAGNLVLSFTAKSPGTYTVTFYNLENRDYQMQLTEG